MSADLKAFVENLIATLGEEYESVEVKDGARTVVRVSMKDGKRLIGPHGEHLRALNTVAKRLIEKQHGEEAASFLIDINDYQEEKLEALRSNVRMLAQRARLFKHEVELSPMSAYERLVVHELFAEDPEIETHSEGEGKFRHIVLKYKGSGGEVPAGN